MKPEAGKLTGEVFEEDQQIGTVSMERTVK